MRVGRRTEGDHIRCHPQDSDGNVIGTSGSTRQQAPEICKGSNGDSHAVGDAAETLVDGVARGGLVPYNDHGTRSKRIGTHR